MKRRIRVKYNKDFNEYFASGKATYPLEWEYERIQNEMEMHCMIKDAVEHSDMEMNFYAVFIAFVTICSLAWAIYEASKL